MCTKMEKDIEYIIFHVANHLKKVLFKCHLCSRTFSHWKYLESHFNTHGLTRDHLKKHKFELLEPRRFGTLKLGTKQFDTFRKSNADTNLPSTNFNFHKLLGFELSANENSRDTLETLDIKVVTLEEAEEMCKEHFILESSKRPVQYQCKLCGYRNNFGKTRIVKHVMAHLKLYPYVCPICDDKFIQDSNLERHLNCHGFTMHSHKQSKFSVINPEIYELQGELKNRFTECRNGLHANNESCETNDQILIRKKIETIEFYDRLLDLTYQCKSCSEICATAKLMKRHILEIHNQSFPYKCDQCQETFSSTGYLKIHLKYHEKKGLMKSSKGGIVESRKNQSEKVDIKCLDKTQILNDAAPKAVNFVSDKDCGYCGIKAESETQLEIPMRENQPLENNFLNTTARSDCEYELSHESLNIGMDAKANLNSKQNDNFDKLLSTTQINEIEKPVSPHGFDLLGNEKFESNENLLMFGKYPGFVEDKGERMSEYSVEEIGDRRQKKVFLENASEPLFFGTRNKLDKVLGGTLYSQAQAEQLLAVSCIKIQDTREYECTVCKGQFRVKSKQLMKTHVFNHYDVYTHQCHHCKDMFRSENQYKTHILAHERKKDKKSKTLPNMNVQKDKIKTGNNYSVSRGEYIDAKSDIDVEDILSVPIEQLKGVKVSTQQGKILMKAYLYRNTKTELFCCQLCDYKRPNASQIHNHILSFHCDVHMYVCPRDDCRMKLLNWGRYTTHEKTHLKIKEREKSEGNDVISEEYLFLKEPVYVGKESGKIIAAMFFRFDANIKKYKCKLCEYSSRHQRVEQHILAAHLPMLNLFQCEVCGKNIRYSEARFKEHVLQHNQKSQNCPKCQEMGINMNQSFSKASLESHTKRYHASNIFICEENNCKQEFATPAQYEKHQQDCHEKTINDIEKKSEQCQQNSIILLNKIEV
eukprot:TRINITY_DN16452_c0_g1_i1.p1 TRINITY_DN16452_c0_g1~~TRINITY_DN16452_c0_g1_i1.p1  ORF type:complete len:928 (-),score=120.00 TRINITY_DN16452_c0_g1_i1:51-2834(-)